MNYPMINNWLVFKRLNEYEVEAKDCLCDGEYIGFVTVSQEFIFDVLLTDT